MQGITNAFALALSYEMPQDEQHTFTGEIIYFVDAGRYPFQLGGVLKK